MKRLKGMWVAIVITIAALTLGACGTQTKEEIKNINGNEFLCTWTHKPASPWIKNDYRCEAFGG